MLNPDKKMIASLFNIGYTYFESRIESIAYVRNICAHYGRLYNAKLSKTPMLYKEYSQAEIKNNRIFGVILCMKFLLKKDTHWNIFINNIDKLFNKYQDININTKGSVRNL